MTTYLIPQDYVHTVACDPDRVHAALRFCEGYSERALNTTELRDILDAVFDALDESRDPTKRADDSIYARAAIAKFRAGNE